MNRLGLKQNLDLLGVNGYSLNDDLKPNSVILFQSYKEWRVFYLDEKGERNNEKIFGCEEDACSYIYQLFNETKKIQGQFGIHI